MQPNHRNKEEIPSVSFSNLIWIFFDALLKFAQHLILFLFKNRIVLSVFLIIGIALGVITNKMSKPVYALSMMVKHTELNAGTFGEMLDNLNDLAGKASDARFAEVIGLPESVSSKIISVKGTTLDGADLRKDTSQQSNRTFLIDLILTDNTIGDSVQKALIHYFNDNPFLHKLKEDKIQLKKDRIAFINTELQKLDSLKTVYNKFLSASGSSSVFYNNAFNPVELYQQSSNYQTEKTAIEEWLRQNSQSVISLGNTTPSVIPKTRGMLVSAFVWGTLFFLFGCLMAAVASVIRNK